MNNSYKPVIGLEIHVELKTKTKMFCDCSAMYFGKEPNTKVCPVCLGLPGAMPVPNEKALEWTILIGKALNCRINKISKFDRKHYFYPDLPKGFQISQYDEPLASQGWLKLKGQNQTEESEENKISITRVHLEEDTAKLLHSEGDTLVDYNRSGVPLVEIVTEPHFDNSEEVKLFLEELHTIIRYLGISDADMEKGSMRMEPNISLINVKSQMLNVKTKAKKLDLPNYKVEVKNINSFNFVKKAIDYEIERQTELLERGLIPNQETRGYDSKKGITYSQRSKEEAQDYRYFPEPDIPPINLAKEFVEAVILPELPQQRIERYIKKGIKFSDAFNLTRNKQLGDKFEKILELNKDEKIKAVDISNTLINKKEYTDLPIDDFYKKLKEAKGPQEVDENLLTEIIKQSIVENQKVVQDYKSGKQNAIMYLVGQVMREMKGKANALLVKQKLAEALKVG